VALLLWAATYRLDAQVTYDRLLRTASEPHNWLSYGGVYLSQRHQRYSQSLNDSPLVLDRYLASGLGRIWNFTTFGIVPFPPSTCQGA